MLPLEILRSYNQRKYLAKISKEGDQAKHFESFLSNFYTQ
ncbi:hypothetical protein N474_18665 [Pseudoalteromonas luteoviolacea CPMOR-2]|uniref:Uncharacterized protein n=1 Tax=Pseudoalteromonas luteoviolacea DSM 6061 TaxID=1365250 RepID=A0A167DA75_9GAMM|nr:hypothetical protein N475_06115 [Pseudoalteromonas luteoviolacea DSM 6061]KZN53976.1 hypothetical protein N474_18665 [Pseudoalteromonas luteoviolacea CPMOR-2]MBE0388693.1 hypothetical protein [Pseudoalteromonas luteoviolacea DSM 6061]